MEAEKIKKLLFITLAVFAGVILLTVAAALLMYFLGGQRFSSDAEAPYPFRGRNKKTEPR